MPHGNAQGAAQAANLAEQQERSKVGMRSGSKVPTSKSKSGFNGYGGDAPLTTTGATQSAGVRGSVGGKVYKTIIQIPTAELAPSCALNPPQAVTSLSVVSILETH